MSALPEDGTPAPAPAGAPLFLRRAGNVSGPFPRKLVEHYRTLGRIQPTDEASADNVHWQPVDDFLGDLPRPGATGKGTDERDWSEERRLAYLRWIDERSGADRRQQQAQDAVPAGVQRSGADRRKDWSPARTLASEADSKQAAARAGRIKTAATVVAAIAILAAVWLALWLFVPRLAPHIALIR